MATRRDETPCENYCEHSYEPDVVLSTVHLGCAATANIGDMTIISEFHYSIPTCISSDDNDRNIEVDEDGDLCMPRIRDTSTTHLAVIEHTMATTLDQVGTQLWSGALLLADYIIHYNELFADSYVLELGSGVGLIGIVASHWAKHIYCTDIGNSILELCHRNVARNCPTLSNDETVNVSVRELDWLQPFCPSTTGDKFQWTTKDMEILKQTTHIVAADVIYEEHLTSALFATLSYLYTNILQTRPTVLIAMEKRINFSLVELAPVSPAYTHFTSSLNKRHKDLLIHGHRLPTTFTQYMEYDRVKELELWELDIDLLDKVTDKDL